MKYAQIVILCTVSASAYAAQTLCLSDEDKVFSCSAGKKVISVCASKDLAADRGYLQYRFGLPNKVELAVRQGLGRQRSVAIEQNGRRLTHVSCKDEPVSKLGNEFFTKAGLKQDKSDFDLP